MAQPHNKKLGEYPMTTRGREQGPEKRYRRLRFPAFTAAKWTAANPLLQRGELGVETDTRKIKVGDGITYWNDLEYSRAETTWGEVNGDITDQADLVNFVNTAVAAEADNRSQADQQLQTNINNVAADLITHEQDTNNPHNVTKAQVGLGNVDNTSDADKPVSTAQAAALDALESKLQSQIASNDTDISNLQNNKADKATDFETPITETNKGATMKEIEEVQTTSIKFKGYVSTTAPASDVYLLVEGNMWINATAMPSSFPVPENSIRVWDGSAWQTTTEAYTPDALDAWSNLNNNEGYYWFGAWKVFSTDLSTEYFTLNQTNGLWEIKQSVHLSGTPTVDTPDGATPQAIVNVDYVNAIAAKLNAPNNFTSTNNSFATQIMVRQNNAFAPVNIGYDVGGTQFSIHSVFDDGWGAWIGVDASGPCCSTPAPDSNSYNIATTSWVRDVVEEFSTPTGTIISFAGGVTPAGYLKCDGSAVSRTTYANLFGKIGTTYGSGDGSTTFNLPQGDDRSLWGNSRGWVSAGLPNITGRVSSFRYGSQIEGANGAFSQTESSSQAKAMTISTIDEVVQIVSLDASRSNSVYGATNTVRPQAIGVTFYIKY